MGSVLLQLRMFKKLFNVMMNLGYVPDIIGKSIVNPTVKNTIISANVGTNYRPISIMPVISKIFEKCVGNIFNHFYKFHNNQFGFVNDRESSNA